MRVVHVIARLNVGGPAAIIDALCRSSHDVEHIVVAGSAGLEEAEWRTLRGSSVEVVDLPKLGPAIAPLADAAALAQLVGILRRLRPDVVHTHTAKAGLVGRAAALAVGAGARVTGRSVGPALVHTFHGHVLHGYFGPSITRGYVRLEKVLARRTDALIAVGGRVREELVAAGIGSPSQYVVIPPGVAAPTGPGRDAARVALGLSPDVRVVALVGRLTSIKRPDRAVQVAARLAGDGRPVVLLVAGDGELRAQTEALARRQGVDARFLGWVADVGAVLDAADLMLLTSDNEGMPVGLIEAAHAGVPVVATDVGSVAEVVLDGVTGRVVATDVGCLADACTELLGDPALRRRLGRAAVLHATAVFGVPSMIDAHRQVYNRVLATRR